MRGRPDVDVQMPASAHPGDEIFVELGVLSQSDTPIDFIDLTFTGEESAGGEAGNPSLREVRPIVHSNQRLREKGTLAAGTHRFRARFVVPAEAPASYMGVRVNIQYGVRLHVSIPWWPDLTETYELIVEPHGSARPKPQAATTTSARGNEAFIELSLTDTELAPNDDVTCAFAVGNTQGRSGLGVEVALVATEHARSTSITQLAEQFRFVVPTVFDASKNGGQVPFQFRIPKDVVPSFESPWCKLTWAVHAALRGGWGDIATCAIPVRIERHQVPRKGETARPDVGTARWRRAWEEAGAPFGLSLQSKQLALEGARADVRLEVVFDQSEDETALIATLRYPSLGLGLSAEQRLLVVLPSALEQLVPGHKVDCRELEQGTAFFNGAVRAALRPFKTMRADDARMVVRLPSPGHDQPWIGRFLEKVCGLADALQAAIDELPPPAAMRQALPAWQELAAATGAHLAVGGMALRAVSFDGAVFDVTTTFGPEAEVTGTRIDLELDPPLAFRVDLDDASSFAAASPGAHELALALRTAARTLKIRPYELSLEIAGATPDPADLRPRMGEMLALARRLRGERTPGPYR
jgi:hypothetical protein